MLNKTWKKAADNEALMGTSVRESYFHGAEDFKRIAIEEIEKMQEAEDFEHWGAFERVLNKLRKLEHEQFKC